jgi:hypothetical protein
MRYASILAVGAMAVGLSAYSARAQAPELKVGVGASSGALNDDDYHMGIGGHGSVSFEQPMGRTASEVALRANYLNYQTQTETLGSDRDEVGVNLAAMVGPNLYAFEPKVGGHVGYERFSGDNFLDLGADVIASVELTPMVDLQAGVTPTWLINQDGNDYLTRLSLGVQWTPGLL